MQEMGRGVMDRDSLPASGVDLGVNPVAGLQPIGTDLNPVPDRLALRLHIDDLSLLVVPVEPAGVGGLPTAFRIEGRFLEEDIRLARLAGYGKDIGNGRRDLEAVVSDKAGCLP